MQDDDGRRHLKASSTVHSGKDVVIASNTQERVAGRRPNACRNLQRELSRDDDDERQCQTVNSGEIYIYIRR